MRRSLPAPVPFVAACLLAGSLLLAAGCGSRSHRPEPGGPALPALVPAADLVARLASGPHPLVLDARGTPAFEDGHVPGARPAAVESLGDLPVHGLDDGFRRRVERLVRAVGARPDIETVVVDAGSPEGFARAATICWALSLAGIERCRQLEGGLPAWISAGGELEKGAADPLEEDPNAPPPPRLPGRPTAFADLDALREATAGGDIALVDATGGEGGGGPAAAAAPGHEAAAAPGHEATAAAPAATIPGMVALPVGKLVSGSGAFDAAAVEPYAAAAGLRAEGEVIVLGEGPLDGAAGWFIVARVLHVPVTRLYPGGLSAWRELPALSGPGAPRAPGAGGPTTPGAGH